MYESQNRTKKQILKEIDELINMIRSKLNKSILLTSHKKLPQQPQPKSIVGGKLKDYQLEALSWMIQLANNGLSGILADDMGLGKTIQTISYWSYLYDTHKIRGKHLIVVPKNVLMNWKREIQKWCPSLTAVILPGTEQQREQCIRKFIKPSKFDILIATYYSVQVVEPVLKKFYWQTLVVDEAHSIKNDQTYLATCLRRLKYKFTLLLTGTPLSNELKELWSLLNFIVPDVFHDNTLFSKIQDSVNINCKDQQEKIRYQSQIASRFKAIISPFLLRRVKAECNLGLKQKKQFTLFVSLTELQLKMYRNYLVTKSVYGDRNKTQMSSHMQLRKICAHPYIFAQIQDPNSPPYGQHIVQNCGKLKLLDKLLKKLLKQGHKVLIFCQFITLIKILQDYCDYRKYKYKVITGQSSIEERDESVEEFGKDKETNIFLISTRAGGIGLNLVAADVVVLYDMDWNPQMDKQATDRAYRIGQKNNVLVFKLITINTIQQRMFEVQKYKLIWDQLVIQKGGLVRVQQAEEKFEKIDKDKIAGLGAEQVFKLQQDFDDKTIDEIIEFGSQKDKKKTQQIRKKLQKQLQKFGDLANPFQELQKNESKLSKIKYEAAVVTHDDKKERKRKLNWKQRQGIKQTKEDEAVIIIPKDYQFYSDEAQAKQLLTKISQSDQETVIKQLQQKLRKIGFYDWSKTDYTEFIKANQQIEKQDYKRISQFIQTKTPQQVQAYSQTYFKEVSTKSSLQKDYKKICKAQEDFVKLKKYNEALKKITNYPPYLFNLSAKSKLPSMNYDAIINLHFNEVKTSGVGLSQYQDLLDLLIPSFHQKVLKVKTENKKKTEYTKLAQKLSDKTQNEVLDELRARYEKLDAYYNKDNKALTSKSANKSVENNQENDSVQTALK